MTINPQKYRWDINKLFKAIDEKLSDRLNGLGEEAIENMSLADKADVTREVIYKLISRTRDVRFVTMYTKEFADILDRVSYTHRLDSGPLIWGEGLELRGNRYVPYKNDFIRKTDARYADKMCLVNTIFFLYRDRMLTRFKSHLWNSNYAAKRPPLIERLPGRIRLFKSSQSLADNAEPDLQDTNALTM